MTGRTANLTLSPFGLTSASALADLVVLAVAAAASVAAVVGLAAVEAAVPVALIAASTSEEAAAFAGVPVADRHWWAQVDRVSLHLSGLGKSKESSRLVAEFGLGVAAGVEPAVAYRAALVAVGLLRPRLVGASA